MDKLITGYIAGVICGVAAVFFIAALHVDSARAACMDLTGADCEMRWVSVEADE